MVCNAKSHAIKPILNKTIEDIDEFSNANKKKFLVATSLNKEDALYSECTQVTKKIISMRDFISPFSNWKLLTHLGSSKYEFIVGKTK